MGQLSKVANPVMAGGAPAASPLPEMSVSPTPAPGLRGPKGLSPRQNTSQVNTAAPPVMDAGATMQKSVSPFAAGALPVKTAQISEEHMSNIAGGARPSIHEMIKAAFDGSANKVNITNEAERQMKLAGAQAQTGTEPVKTAAAAPTEKLAQLADALDFAAECVKQGAIHISAGSSSGSTPGEGPGALHVMQAQASGKISDNSGQAKSSLIPSKSPGVQGSPATQMANNLNDAAGPSGHQQTSMVNQKHGSAPIELIRKLAGSTKVAEDAINPAHISAGKAVPPDTREGGQAGGVAPAGGQTSLVGSSQAAIAYTRGQAKSVPKQDLAAYLTEPAHSAAHDHVLQNAWSHTGQAGAKIASPQESQDAAVKTAAARALLTNLVEQVTPPAR